MTIDSKALGAVARAIWNIRRKEEDRCDMELEDMGRGHSVWSEARAAIRAIRATSPSSLADANHKIGDTGTTAEGVEYVVVPKEPSIAMLKACNESKPENATNEQQRASVTRVRDSARRIRAMDYRAMTSPEALKGGV